MSKNDDKPSAAQRKMKFDVPQKIADAIRKCGQVVSEKKLREAVADEVFSGMTPERVKEIAKDLIAKSLDALEG